MLEFHFQLIATVLEQLLLLGEMLLAMLQRVLQRGVLDTEALVARLQRLVTAIEGVPLLPQGLQLACLLFTQGLGLFRLDLPVVRLSLGLDLPRLESGLLLAQSGQALLQVLQPYLEGRSFAVLLMCVELQLLT